MSEEKTIEERVCEMVADELGFDIADVTPNASIDLDLGGDLLDTTEVVIAAEEKFDIEISDEDAENVQTVGDLIKIVETKIAANAR